MMGEFHFIRPELLWLLALPTILLLTMLFTRHQSTQLSEAIDEHLRAVLMPNQTGRSQQIKWRVLLVLTLLALAAAGPAYNKAPTPTAKGDLATIVLLDLSPSMFAQDIAPTRNEHSKRKLQDLLSHLDTDLVSLIVYSGEAYGVIPLTDDPNTIIAMLPVLDPQIMPNYGSYVELAIDIANEQAERHQGATQVVIITDGIQPQAIDSVNQLNNSLPTAVLLVGSTDGAPIPTSNGYMQQNGSRVIAKPTPLNLAELKVTFAARSTSTDRDVRALATAMKQSYLAGEQSDETFDRYIDRGPWLALVAMLLMLPAVRPVSSATAATLALVALPLLTIGSSHTQAANILQSDTRQTYESYQNSPSKETAFALTDPRWRAYALAQQGERQPALETYGSIDQPTESDLVNIANNLTREGAYPQAEAVYKRALALNAGNEKAQLGLQIIEALKQQSDQESQQQGNQSNEQQDNPQDSENEGESDKDSEQDSEQQSSDQGKQDESEQQGEQSEQNQSDSEQSNNEQSPQSKPTPAEQKISEEEAKQELEQLLRQLPDDPGGLLRRKFRHEYDKNYRKRMVNRTQGERW